MFEFLKSDSFLFGMIAGIVLLFCSYIIFYFAGCMMTEYFQIRNYLQPPVAQMLAILVNVLLFRAYMVSWKKQETGKGILLITFICGLLYLYFFNHHNN